MVLNHVWGLFTHPNKEWSNIRNERCSVGKCFCSHVLILAAIPVISGYIGTTQIGWQIGAGDPIKLTPGSALTISLMYYMTLLVAIFTMGGFIKWMAKTYGSDPTFPQAVALAAYAGTPLFLFGFMQLYPLLWLNLILGLPVLGYTVFLFYRGVPVMMNIPEERGFLFSTAILTVGMVMLVAVMAATVILWLSGFGPAYTN